MIRKFFVFFVKKLINLFSEKRFFTKDNFDNSDYNIGDFTYGVPLILNWGDGSKLQIGKFCSISANVTILLGGNHRTDWISTYPFSVLNDVFPNAKFLKGISTSKGDVNIGNDVWIGRGVTILSGVTIGDGTVIGANCTVSKNILPYSIVVGNPCRVVKKRFSDEVIEKLLEIKWWNWSHDSINENIHLIMSMDIDSLIKKTNEKVSN